MLDYDLHQFHYYSIYITKKALKKLAYHSMFCDSTIAIAGIIFY